MEARAQEVLAFVRRYARTRPKDVQAHFDHGRIKRLLLTMRSGPL